MNPDLESACERFPLVQWLEARGFEAQNKPGEWLGTCPKCSKLKLTVNSDRVIWNCYRCSTEGGRGRNVVGLLAWVTGVRYAQVAAWLVSTFRGAHGLARIDSSLREPELPTSAILVPPGPPVGLQSLGPEHMAYLVRRGINAAQAARYGLMAALFRDGPRVVVPARELDGRWLYWQARTILPGVQPKTLNPPSKPGTVTAQACVGNLAQAIQIPRPLVICEGPFSAMKASDSAVWLWGKVLGARQLAVIIASGARDVILYLDGDEAGREAAERMVSQLVPVMRSVWVARVPDGQDPGDLDRGENARCIASAQQVGLGGACWALR